MIETFIDNPILLLFVVAALGYWLGNIRFKGGGLGVAAVLFVGLAFGALDPGLQIPETIIFLGLSIFVYTIGLQNGPGFIRNIRQHGLRDVLFVILMLILSVGITVGLHYLFHFNASTSAGLFAGVTTNTAALAGLLDAIAHSGVSQELIKQLSREAVVGYSLGYPMGVFGVILAIFLIERILRINYLNRDYALDFLLQGRIAANTGTSSIFDAHHDGDHVCALKNLWSTRLYCTSAFHNETLIHNPG